MSFEFILSRRWSLGSCRSLHWMNGISLDPISLCVPSMMKLIILECYMGWFPSLICKNYIFKDFVKTIEATSLKFCTILKLRTLHPEKTTAQVKFANCSNAHAQTFVLLNGEMAIVSACFRKLKFWLWLLWTVFFLKQTGFLKIGLNKLS